MNYSVNLNNKDIILPRYSVAIFEKLEDYVKFSEGNASGKDKLAKLYKTLADIIGKDTVEDVIGSFKECDPNELNLLWLKVRDAYSAPVEDYTSTSASETIDKYQLAELAGIFDKLNQSGLIAKD